MPETDANLREDKSVFSMLEEYGAWAVVAGVVVEVVYAAIYRGNKPFGEAWTPVFASGLIAFGVIVEILSSRKAAEASDELDRRSNEKVAAANECAANAERETEKLRAEFGWRFISGEQMPRLVHLLGQSQGPVVIIYSIGDVESESYATQFMRAFVWAGWFTTMKAVHFERLEFGLRAPESLEPLGQPPRTLRDALRAVGIPFESGPIPFSGLNRVMEYEPQRRFAEIPADFFIGPKPYPYAMGDDAKNTSIHARRV